MSQQQTNQMHRQHSNRPNTRFSYSSSLPAATAAAAMFDGVTFAPTAAMLEGHTIAGVEPSFFEARATAWPLRKGYMIDLTNRPPVAVADGGTTPFGTPLTVNVLANDSDPDAGNTISVVSAVVTSGTGAVVNNNDGTLTYTPGSGEEGQVTVDYTIQDGGGLSATATWTLVVETAVAKTDLLANYDGSFDTGTGWSLSPEVSITGGQLVGATTTNGKGAFKFGGGRIPCGPNQVIDLELDVADRGSGSRVRVTFRSYTSAGAAIDTETLAFDTSAGDTLAVGINTKLACYTTAAGAATLQVSKTYTNAPGDTIYNRMRLLV